MKNFLWGAAAMACLAIGLRFLRFFKDTRDRLFAYFSLAFWVLGLNWLLLEIFQPPSESRHIFYLLRLLAFLLIVMAIVDKNLTKRD
jgi:hypothetical protein